MRKAKTASWPLCPQSANLYWLPCLGRASYRLSNVFTSRWRWYLHDYACVVLVSRKPPHRCTSGYSALSRVRVKSPYAGCFGVSSLSWPKGLDIGPKSKYRVTRFGNFHTPMLPSPLVKGSSVCWSIFSYEGMSFVNYFFIMFSSVLDSNGQNCKTHSSVDSFSKYTLNSRRL